MLHLADNKLSGQMSTTLLRGLSSLEYLFLNDNRLTGPVPVNELAALPQIKSIYLSNNSFDDVEIASNALSQAVKPRKVEVDMLGQGLYLFSYLFRMYAQPYDRCVCP